MKEFFSHDHNARNDTKIQRLIMKKGLEGLGAYWCIVEMLAEEDGYLMLTECDRIAFELRKDSDWIESLIKDFDLFDFDDDRFWSESLLRRLEVKYDKSKQAKEAAERRWEKYRKQKDKHRTNSDNADAMRTHSGCNAIKLNETKLNETIDTALSEKSESEIESERIAKHLLESICEYDPTHKYNRNEPALSTWEKDIERAIRLDGRTEEQLIYIIDYIYKQNGKNSQFWAGNIESGNKLRQHFDKIKNQITAESHNGKKSISTKIAETEQFLASYQE